MSRAAFDQVIERARTDEGFQAQLGRDPVRARAVYELTPDEFRSLRAAVSDGELTARPEQTVAWAAGATR